MRSTPISVSDDDEIEEAEEDQEDILCVVHSLFGILANFFVRQW